MRKILILLTLFLSVISFGQKKETYQNIRGLTLIDSIDFYEISGSFSKSNGHTGYRFQLDSNMTFHKIDFDCISRFKVDSGTWFIKNNKKLIFNSSDHILSFDIFKFDNFYFLILPSERKKFIADLNAERKKLRNTRAFVTDNKRYSIDYLVGFRLVNKYYAKEIEDFLI
ncbi:MAG TPA: hypothetical protein VF487_00580 [Chitinophagaceae bacterium]